MRISIVGGGIAGLALAAILDPARFDVTVYEEHPDRRGLGTALGMWPAAQRALRRAGAASVLDSAVDVLDGSLRTIHGEVLATPQTPAQSLSLVGRTDLLDALSCAVPASVQRVTARVEDPSGLDADLVVAADGVHSAIRRAVWGPRATSRATPYLAVRGLVGPDHDAYGEYWGSGRLFGITPVPGGATNWFCSYRSHLGPRAVDVAEALTDARARYADAAPAIRATLAEATPTPTLAQRIWVAPPMRSYVRGRVVLIGDAAHAMTPNLGRGACESLVDAHVLGDALNHGDPNDPATALRSYQARRVAASQAVRAASGAAARVALARRFAGPRDVAIRTAGRLTGTGAAPARAVPAEATRPRNGPHSGT